MLWLFSAPSPTPTFHPQSTVTRSHRHRCFCYLIPNYEHSNNLFQFSYAKSWYRQANQLLKRFIAAHFFNYLFIYLFKLQSLENKCERNVAYGTSFDFHLQISLQCSCWNKRSRKKTRRGLLAGVCTVRLENNVVMSSAETQVLCVATSV